MRMPLAGVVGWPIAHSLSPRLHGFWLDAHHIAGAYVKLAVVREDFAFVLAGLQRAGFAGVNVTIPHKQAAFALAAQWDTAARLTGAANLLVFQEDGTILARNTDVEGLRRSLEEDVHVPGLRGGQAVVLGAGGAARAAVLALSELGCAKITLLNRTRARAEALVATLAPALGQPLEIGAIDDWPHLAQGAALLVNCTSLGLEPQTSFTLDLKPLPDHAVVCDVVYHPSGTALVRAARQRGLHAVDGLGMLMYQAVPSFAAFFGVTPQVSPAVRAHLEASRS